MIKRKRLHHLIIRLKQTKSDINTCFCSKTFPVVLYEWLLCMCVRKHKYLLSLTARTEDPSEFPSHLKMYKILGNKEILKRTSQLNAPDGIPTKLVLHEKVNTRYFRLYFVELTAEEHKAKVHQAKITVQGTHPSASLSCAQVVAILNQAYLLTNIPMFFPSISLLLSSLPLPLLHSSNATVLSLLGMTVLFTNLVDPLTFKSSYLFSLQKEATWCRIEQQILYLGVHNNKTVQLSIFSTFLACIFPYVLLISSHRFNFQSCNNNWAFISIC